ncbi:MAG: hypothetical protein ABS808_04175 [Wolbachia endosymbiont of Polyergus mexicanus]|uniref:Uncharacterized protein n=1 Tax=Wolbachia endosymbiont of Polyergus mexicanus TaxID=3171167 RepID=A0AAU7YJL1_9RICK
MTYTLNLQNVTYFTADANPILTGPKHYNIKMQNPGIGATTQLILNNSKHVASYWERTDDEVGDKIFDCEFNYIDESTGATKRIFEVHGLKLDRRVEYDAENHVATVVINENNDHLDLFI